MLRIDLLNEIVFPIEVLTKEDSNYATDYLELRKDLGKVVFVVQGFNNFSILKKFLKENAQCYESTIKDIVRDCFLELYYRIYGAKVINLNLLHEMIYQVKELLIKKNTDYGNSYFELRKEFGKVAFLVRIADKLARLKTLVKQQAQVEESEEDTIKDIIGYCLLELYYKQYYGGESNGMDKDKEW
ncbi:nucleotide modification associated domain-containing protein [Thermodesulfovibrio sp. 1176]|uniref:nucleotide modification associated domain-containing protein n=1 Tax=Thermodesulfovibrio sp. 1176 TaxID=3043424 RepID=UPI002482EC40|nr:nucleotide modification associated domain-containing protein [Thermodesulfovibrio sp. 1176]MDI1472988.1 nucleotide modification associated domain-containing protein [Thermodesulfovibrio sp. 1176]